MKLRRIYRKQPTTYDEQISLLLERGLLISDETKARRYLQQISYYRLSAYFLSYQQSKNKFNEGVSFNNILDLYKFDRELRLLVFDCIERIEVAIRSQMNHVLVQKYNSSHWQDREGIFKPSHFNKLGEEINPYHDFQTIIQKSCNSKHPEVFIKHYKEKYHSPTNPPSWMCIELLTIGELSRLYNGLLENSDKQAIASFFGLHYNVFTSWLHTLTYVRNICAHHARLWNRVFAIKPDILIKPQRDWISNSFNNNQRTFYFLCTLKYLLNSANSNNHLTNNLNTLFLKYSNVPIQFLGIPTDNDGSMLDWRKQALWL